MEFGKLANFDSVDFTLPSDHLVTQLLLENLPQANYSQTLYIGCTGWSMKEWVGKVYPKGTKNKDFLHFYSQQFNTIELNSTHYHIPSIETVQQWYEQSSPDFKFCPKIPQVISHSHDLGINNNLTQQFCTAISVLKEKLGCCFMQMPPYWNFKNLSILEHFLFQFPKEIPLAIEIRHEDWFKNSNQLDAFLKLLQSYNIATVITDVAGRRDVLHQCLTKDIAMIRFVGNALHVTDYQRINDWIARLQYWFAKGIKEVYFFTHEPDNLLAPDLAFYIASHFHQKLPNINIKIPQWYDNESPTIQFSLF